MRKLTLDCIEESMMESEVFWLKSNVLENIVKCHHLGNDVVSLGTWLVGTNKIL